MKKILLLVGTSVGMVGLLPAQVPDLLNSLDSGSRSMGAGGAFGVTSSDTFSILNNPAGLGYITTKTYGFAVRNLPSSQTDISGSLSNRRLNSVADRGRNNLSHLGYAVPLKDGRVLGISYQIGGFVNDTAFGQGLTEGTLTGIQTFENFRSQTDFYTVALGKASSDGSSSIGYGLTFANSYMKNQILTGIPGNPATILNNVDFEGRASGVGFVAGYQFTPKNQPNTSVGVSVRTPIKLNGNDNVTGLYNTIPGQFSLGFATRIDNFRGASNYLVYGAQLSNFFGGDGTGPADRSRNQSQLGLGAEYNIVRDDVTYPVRLGYVSNPSGGNGFLNRNGMTFGLGYRKAGNPWSLDINYMYPRGQSPDFALAFNYRVEK